MSVFARCDTGTCLQRHQGACRRTGVSCCSHVALARDNEFFIGSVCLWSAQKEPHSKMFWLLDRKSSEIVAHDVSISLVLAGKMLGISASGKS